MKPFLRRARILLVVLCAVVMLGCDYEPYKVFERDVDPNFTPSQINTVALTLQADTLRLYHTKEVRFTFSSSNQDIVSVTLLLDDEYYSMRYDSSGIFYIDYESLSKGVHKLKMQVIARSGTGSIADFVGAEGSLYEREWVLIVLTPDGENYYIDNGFLTLFWHGQNQIDPLYSYKLKLSSWPEDVIGYTPNTELTDSACVGESRTYAVFYEYIGMDYSIFLGNFSTPQLIPNVSFFSTNNNEYKLKWNKTKFYNATQNYDVYINSNLAHSTSGVNDTTYQLTNVKFGQWITGNLVVVPKYYNSIYELSSPFNMSSSFDFLAGYQIKSFEKIFTISDNLILGFKDPMVYRYSLSSETVLEEKEWTSTECSTTQFRTPAISQNGEMFTASVGCNNDVYYGSTHDFSSFTIHNFNSLTGGNPTGEVKISDNGIGVIPGQGVYYMYDFNTGTVIGSYIDNVWTDKFAISPSGNYFFFVNKLYRFESETLSQVGYQFGYVHYFRFFPDNSRILLFDTEKVKIRNCSDFSTVAQYNLEFMEEIVDIDFSRNLLLTYQSGYMEIETSFVLRNLMDGSIIQRIPTAIYPWGILLNNNKIVSSGGLVYFLNL